MANSFSGYSNCCQSFHMTDKSILKPLKCIEMTWKLFEWYQLSESNQAKESAKQVARLCRFPLYFSVGELWPLLLLYSLSSFVLSSFSYPLFTDDPIQCLLQPWWASSCSGACCWSRSLNEMTVKESVHHRMSEFISFLYILQRYNCALYFFTNM